MAEKLLDRLPLDDAKLVPYLAYGSNLSASTFLGRRGIRPVSSHPVFVPTLDLVFDLPGVPYLEPCFANVRPNHDPPTASADALTPLLAAGHRAKGLYGVVYMVTPSDYAKIIATEGGGASYADEIVETFPLDDSLGPIMAHTLHAPPSMTRRVEPSAEASPRYMQLLVTGSREHGLPDKWTEYLEALPAYVPKTLGQKAGRAIIMVVWFPVMMTWITLAKVLSDENGRSPRWVQRAFAWFAKGMWATYDCVLKPLLGDGERGDGEGAGRLVGGGKWYEEREEEITEDIAEGTLGRA